MKKRAYFDKYWGPGWPDLRFLEPYFLAAPGQEWFFDSGNDGAVLNGEGLYNTEHLEPKTGRIDVRLYMSGSAEHGVCLTYDKWDGREQRKHTLISKGDLGRLREFVRSLHGDPISVGLFISFREAWKAVREFIETDGELPESIEWISISDLPPETFPAP
jgi:hypothetical protein